VFILYQEEIFFKVALGYMANRTQSELMIRWVQCKRRTKDVATQVVRDCNTKEVTFQNMGILSTNVGKMMTHSCLDHIKIATT